MTTRSNSANIAKPLVTRDRVMKDFNAIASRSRSSSSWLCDLGWTERRMTSASSALGHIQTLPVQCSSPEAYFASCDRGFCLTVVFCAHAAVPAIIRTPILASKNFLECIANSVH